MKIKQFNTMGFVMDFEAGELTKAEIIEGFQYLINSGLCWQLQGCYGRTATRLIEAGLCHVKGDFSDKTIPDGE